MTICILNKRAFYIRFPVYFIFHIGRLEPFVTNFRATLCIDFRVLLFFCRRWAESCPLIALSHFLVNGGARRLNSAGEEHGERRGCGGEPGQGADRQHRQEAGRQPHDDHRAHGRDSSPVISLLVPQVSDSILSWYHMQPCLHTTTAIDPR